MGLKTKGFVVKHIITIGGATVDTFLDYQGADTMSISHHGIQSSYMLFASGEKVEIDKVIYKSGGGATNAAVSFSRLGFKVSVVCCIGTDSTGKSVLQELESSSVSCVHVRALEQAHTGVSYVVTSRDGERTIFTHRGANTQLNQSHIPFEMFSDCNAVYITSLSQDAAQTLPFICEQAQKKNVLVAVNPGSSQLTKGTLTLKQSLKNIDILILNSQEAQAFSGALVRSDENYKKLLESTNNPCALGLDSQKPYLLESAMACPEVFLSINAFFREVMSIGPKIVVVTNGANGVYVAHDSKVYFQPALPTKVINSVGAGDAFGSCFVGSLQAGYSIEEAIKYGVINSSNVLKHIGAKEGLLSFESLKEAQKNLPNKLVISAL